MEKPFGIQLHGAKQKIKRATLFRTDISKILSSSWSDVFFLGGFNLLFFYQTSCKVIVFCSYYYLLFLQLEPLAEDILHQTPNMNAIISLQKIIEIQSMS